jgi:hypothetical protein
MCTREPQSIVRIEYLHQAPIWTAQDGRRRQEKSRATLGGGDSEGTRLDD